MALYLKPPRGMVDYSILQKCVDERLQFFKNTTCSSLHNMQYLYEDSAFDRAGHFTLRLAAVKHYSFIAFFIKSEIRLLNLRLNSLKCKTILVFLKTQLRHAKECIADANSEKIHEFLMVFINVIRKMLTRSYHTHVFDDEHKITEKCKVFKLNVPFQYCSSLIVQREFSLKNGYVQIPCDNWKDLIISFYYTYLKLVLNIMHHSKNVQMALNDDRISAIIASVVQNDIKDSKNNLLSINIDRKYFPLCMQNLQNILETKHRLAHEERFNLSLFLKDVGMSLNDSIAYWKFEYSQEHTDCTKCSHSWQQDEKRYIYSIRHLYGLEGARKTYKTRSCSYFQKSLEGPRQEGGCPFQHFDNLRLQQLLSNEKLGLNTVDVNNILLLDKTSTSSSNACRLLLQTVVGKNLTNINFKDPVEYYLSTRNIN